MRTNLILVAILLVSGIGYSFENLRPLPRVAPLEPIYPGFIEAFGDKELKVCYTYETLCAKKR